MFFTYILYSVKADTFYVGQTNNLSERLNRHNAGAEKYTSKGIPWKLIWFTCKESRIESIELESKLKNLSRSRKISFMIKYLDGIAGPDEMLLLKHLSGS